MMPLEGNSILSLPSTTSIDLDADQFLVSTRDKYLCRTYDSKRVDADNLLKYLISTVSSDLNLGSMAYEESSDYSLTSHSHDSMYDKVNIQLIDYPGRNPKQSVDVSYEFTGYPIKKASIDAYLSIGNTFADGVLSTIYVPMSCMMDVLVLPWQISEPQFGSIKFAATYGIDAIDYKSDAFDGWLYFNNYQAYDLTAFRLSNEISNASFVQIEQAYGITQFRIKQTCDSFVKIENSSPFEYVPGHNYVKNHTHPIQMEINGTLSVEGNIISSINQGDGGMVHAGIGWSTDGVNELDYAEKNKAFSRNGVYCGHVTTLDNWQSKWRRRGNIVYFPSMELTAQCQIHASMGSDSILPSSIESETYPSHNIMPMMVYVGRKAEK